MMARLVRAVTASVLGLAAATVVTACSGRSNPAAPSARAEAAGSALAVVPGPAAPTVVAWACLTTPGCSVAHVSGQSARAVLALTAPSGTLALTTG